MLPDVTSCSHRRGFGAVQILLPGQSCKLIQLERRAYENRGMQARSKVRRTK